MEERKLGLVEGKFADLIWQHAPMTTKELVALCEKELNWKRTTTYTVLKKLCERGFARNEGAVVTALIPREQVQAFESEHFVERTFDGSLPGFLAAFLGGKTISKQEADALKRLIDEHKEG